MTSKTLPAVEATIHLGVGLSIVGYFVAGRELRYGTAYISDLLGHSSSYMGDMLKDEQRLQTGKNCGKKLKALRCMGFTGRQKSIKAPRPGRGATRAETLSLDDFCIWVEYEAIEEKNPKAIALLTASFREVLLGRSLAAFNLPEQSLIQKQVTFQESYESYLERERLFAEDRLDLESLALPGDEGSDFADEMGWEIELCILESLYTEYLT